MLCGCHLAILRILFLNMCFVCEVQWDNGACAWGHAMLAQMLLHLLQPPCLKITFARGPAHYVAGSAFSRPHFHL